MINSIKRWAGNRFNKPLHILGGWLSSFVPCGMMIWTRRESLQMPAENAAHPVVFVVLTRSGYIATTQHNPPTPQQELFESKYGHRWVEYGSRERFEDSLRDLDECALGHSAIGWWTTVGIGILIGWGVWG